MRVVITGASSGIGEALATHYAARGATLALIARRIARVIDSGTRYAVVPGQMAVVAKLLRLPPNRLFDAILSGRGRKPRIADL